MFKLPSHGRVCCRSSRQLLDAHPPFRLSSPATAATRRRMSAKSITAFVSVPSMSASGEGGRVQGFCLEVGRASSAGFLVPPPYLQSTTLAPAAKRTKYNPAGYRS